jgi:hypothetical protein
MGDTAGYSGIQRDTAGYSGIQRDMKDTAGYSGIQRDTIKYTPEHGWQSHNNSRGENVLTVL